MDEGVRQREQPGHKGCLCFKQHSHLRNVPLGHSRELPTANNALNVSYGWASTGAAGAAPRSQLVENDGYRELNISGVPPLPFPQHKRMETLCSLTKRFPNTNIFIVSSAFRTTVI